MSEKEIKVNIIQPLEISETEGFEQDELGRKGFGESMAQILENQPGGNVFALDAGWGQGKTTFIKMWRGHVGKQDRLKTIYFDAFASDYQQDPFLALAAEIYENIRQRPLKKAILNVEKFKATSSIIGGALLESAVGKTGSEVAKKLFEAHDAILTRRLEEAQKARGAIDTFRDSLEQHVKKISPDKPLIFIVDELDRCRPDFALDLLETIKHFFEVPGIVFLLVMNHEALNEMIRTRYGTDDGRRYMQKFVQFWFALPEPDIERYARFVYIGYLEEPDYTCELIKQGALNLREVQQICAYRKLIDSPTERDNSRNLMQWAISLVCYIKVIKPDFLPKILLMSDDDVLNFKWESVLNFFPSDLFVGRKISTINDMEERLISNFAGGRGRVAELIKKYAEILITLRVP